MNYVSAFILRLVAEAAYRRWRWGGEVRAWLALHDLQRGANEAEEAR